MRWSSRLFLLLLGAVPLTAQAAQRTFVASSGVDTNPCSLVAPCRSFGTAVAAVAVGGEVIVLDSAGYGAVTITKSVSIVAPPGVYAGVNGFGIVVDGFNVRVVLRGLTLSNLVAGGGTGIDFAQGAALHIENCIVSGFAWGIQVRAAESVTHILDSIVRDGVQGIAFDGVLAGNMSRTRVEGNAITGVEIYSGATVAIEDSVVSGSTINIDLHPIAPGTVARVSIARTLVSGGIWGIYVEPGGSFAEAHASVMDSTIVGQMNAGIVAEIVPPFAVAVVTAARNQMQNNGSALLATGSSATLIADGNMIVKNGSGVAGLAGATIVTRGNNTVYSNGTDTIGTPYTSLGGI
jgi:hypothetical protein